MQQKKNYPFCLMNIFKISLLVLTCASCSKEDPFGKPSKREDYLYFIENNTNKTVFVSTWLKDEIRLDKCKMKPKKRLLIAFEPLWAAGLPEDTYPPNVSRIKFELEDGSSLEQVCENPENREVECSDTTSIFYRDNYIFESKPLIFGKIFNGMGSTNERIYVLEQLKLLEFK